MEVNIKTNTLRGKVASNFAADGRDGLTPYIKDEYWWIGGENTGVRATGPEGAQGAAGEAGHTPIRGEDYWTQDDQDAMKSYIDVHIQYLREDVTGAEEELRMLNEGGVE